MLCGVGGPGSKSHGSKKTKKKMAFSKTVQAGKEMLKQAITDYDHNTWVSHVQDNIPGGLENGLIQPVQPQAFMLVISPLGKVEMSSTQGLLDDPNVKPHIANFLSACHVRVQTLQLEQMAKKGQETLKEQGHSPCGLQSNTCETLSGSTEPISKNPSKMHSRRLREAAQSIMNSLYDECKVLLNVDKAGIPKQCPGKSRETCRASHTSTCEGPCTLFRKTVDYPNKVPCITPSYMLIEDMLELVKAYGTKYDVGVPEGAPRTANRQTPRRGDNNTSANDDAPTSAEASAEAVAMAEELAA
jgi:hypothetical protein